ncbi:MAG TPA: metallophosphoesterase, partial [Geminicoccaceae bacterium]
TSDDRGEVTEQPLAGDEPVAAASTGEPSPDVAGVPPPEEAPPTVQPPAVLPVVDVHEFDWAAVRDAVDAPAIRARMRAIVERMEGLLDSAGGPGMLFDADRADAADRAIKVSAVDAAATAGPLWIVGDLHGDLLALEAALALVRDHASRCGGARPRLVLLGDLFDDEGFGLEVLLRVFELIVEAPELVCVLAGNHDEALSYDGARFGSSVAPSDFTDFLNANLAHEWIGRAGKLAVRLFARAPRALFLPDGLLMAHGGFPLTDLHPRLAETGDWNDPACLADFVWTRAHPKARRKLPNRFSRGSQFGYEDFAAFCRLSANLGRPVTRMVRGHDHVDERYEVYPAYHAYPVLTTVALSRRLHRERFGPYERVPTLALVVEGTLPQVHRLHVPADIIRAVYPEPDLGDGSDHATTGEMPA